MIFTPEELAREGRPLSVQAEEALQAGRLDELRYLLGKMASGHLGLCWGYIHWTARLFGKVLLDFGETYFETVTARIADYLVSPWRSQLQQGREKEVLSEIASLWVCQMARVKPLGETASEISFLLRPCGSGGRLELEACHEIDPRTYPRTGNGTPVFCRVCEHLQQALNQGFGRTFWRALRDPDRRGFCRLQFYKRAGRGSRLFEPGELVRLTTPRCALALSKLDQGILEIRDLLRDQHQEWRPLHDLLCLMVTSLFSIVADEKGIPYLTGLVWDTYVTLFESAYRMHAVLDDRALVREMVRNWTYHQATFRVAEEDDRFIFTLDPCGSGGRLFRGEMGPPGCFGYGSGLLSLLSTGSDLTFQRSQFPVYCIHCAATNRDQFLGRPWPFIVDGSAMLTPEAPCRQYLYKKNAARRVSPELLRQVGLEAVKPLRKEYLV